MLLLVISEDPPELFLFGFLDLDLLTIDHDLLADLLLLLHDLLGHIILDGGLLLLLLGDLVIHELALLVDLLDKCFILGAELGVFVCHILLLGEALTVLADLMTDLGQVRFEIGYDILSLDLLGGDDPLMVLLERLVLVLILSGQYLILVKYDLCAPLLLIVDVVRFVNEELVLELQLNMLLVRVLQLFQDFLQVELVELLNLGLTVKVDIVVNGFKLGDKLVSLSLRCFPRGISTWTTACILGLFRA
jgi:hypothetical protein